MKFCANCGTQILDEATGCPQCKTSPSNQQSTNNQHSHTSKKFNKMIIVIPLVVFATALITTIGSYFTLLYLNDIFPIKDESYIENIIRLNKGKVATFYMTYNDSLEYRDKVYRGIIQAAGKDHIVISDTRDGKRYILLLVYLDYVEFDEPINYEYPIR